MRVAPEGRPFIALGGGVWVAVFAAAWAWGGWWWVPLAAWTPVALWIPLFFRDPARDGARGPGVIIAAADGRVVAVKEVDEPEFVKGRATQVSVFMNVFNVHVNRYPVDGTVEHRNYRPGKFFNASLDKASVHNEQMSLGIRSGRGPVLVRQIAGLIARRIVTDQQPGARVRQGERLGIIRFGSRVDVFFPAGAVPKVQVGDHTVAGVTVIGQWTR
jgi:phosphatidylserine decarboxylase